MNQQAKYETTISTLKAISDITPENVIQTDLEPAERYTSAQHLLRLAHAQVKAGIMWEGCLDELDVVDHPLLNAIEKLITNPDPFMLSVGRLQSWAS